MVPVEDCIECSVEDENVGLSIEIWLSPIMWPGWQIRQAVRDVAKHLPA